MNRPLKTVDRSVSGARSKAFEGVINPTSLNRSDFDGHSLSFVETADAPACALRPARVSDAPILARMMVEGLDSRLKDLGPWFVTYLHRHFVQSRHCLCLVAEQDGRILGYVATLISTRRFYREFLLRKGIGAALMMLPWLLWPRNLRTVTSGLTYFSGETHDDPETELVSLIVVPKARGLRVGSTLFQQTLARLRAAGTPRMMVCTSTENVAANAFYRKHNCRLAYSKPLYHDASINVFNCDHLLNRLTGSDLYNYLKSLDSDH